MGFLTWLRNEDEIDRLKDELALRTAELEIAVARGELLRRIVEEQNDGLLYDLRRKAQERRCDQNDKESARMLNAAIRDFRASGISWMR